MIYTESFLMCDGCELTFGKGTKNVSGTLLRDYAKDEGWKLIVGDGYRYGDYCPSCISIGKHKKIEAIKKDT